MIAIIVVVIIIIIINIVVIIIVVVVVVVVVVIVIVVVIIIIIIIMIVSDERGLVDEHGSLRWGDRCSRAERVDARGKNRGALRVHHPDRLRGRVKVGPDLGDHRGCRMRGLGIHCETARKPGRNLDLESLVAVHHRGRVALLAGEVGASPGGRRGGVRGVSMLPVLFKGANARQDKRGGISSRARGQVRR